MSQHSSRGAAWESVRLFVLERDNHICQHCGREATTADHIVPKSKGGKDVPENLVASCVTCNSKRGDKDLVRASGFNPRWLDGLS